MKKRLRIRREEESIRVEDIKSKGREVDLESNDYSLSLRLKGKENMGGYMDTLRS